MRKRIYFIALFLITLLNSSAYAFFNLDQFIDRHHYEGYIGAGPRLLNDQVMPNTNLDTAIEVGLSASTPCNNKPCYVGLQLFANNAWDARFNSVNAPGNTNTIPALVHNSASMDLLLFVGESVGKWQGELGFGPQFSWLKWLGSPQQAEDRLRVLPKLRVALSRQISNKTYLYFAFNQAFNPYGSMACASGAFNCINDEGFVSVSDWKLGASVVL